MKENQFQKTNSSKSGVFGWFETFVRKNKFFNFFLIYAIVAIFCALILALSLFPGVLLVLWTYQKVLASSLIIKALALSFSLVGLFLSYIVSIIFITPFFNTVVLQIPRWLKPFRGNMFSLEGIPWFIHNAFIYIVRYTCLEFITPSPLNVLFYKMMGMKIGKGVIINTSNISDACLITLGDYVTLGGSAHLLTHYSQAGFLVVSTLEIKRESTIGLKASVFGNVVIGERCTVGPHQVVLPRTRLEDGSKV